jgi:hypothetical protein
MALLESQSKAKTVSFDGDLATLNLGHLPGADAFPDAVDLPVDEGRRVGVGPYDPGQVQGATVGQANLANKRFSVSRGGNVSTGSGGWPGWRRLTDGLIRVRRCRLGARVSTDPGR